MKKEIYGILLAAVLGHFPGKATAQEIRVEGVRFVRPIVEKWVAEYKKTNPDAGFEVKAVAEADAEASGLTVVADRIAEDEANGGGRVVYVGRYALIPVSNRHNPLIGKVGKGLKKKELKNLLFEKDLSDDDAYGDGGEEKYAATIYSRSGSAPTTRALAEHFAQLPERIRGKKIVGDEIYLLNALQKDELGVAYNTLNYVYDLQTRRLKEPLAVLPLNLKSEQREALLSGDIDRTISALEEARIEAVPVEKIGLVIPEAYAGDAEVLKFAGWILDQGQQFNHALGFLTLDSGTLAAQKRELADNGRLSYLKRP